MTNVTKLWLRVIFAGAFTLCAVRIAMAMAITNGPFHIQSWEPSLLISKSGNFHGNVFTRFAGDGAIYSDSASIKNFETVLLDTDMWDSEPFPWMPTIMVLSESHDRKFLSVDEVAFDLLLLRGGYHGYGLDLIGDRLSSCDFSPEGCQGAGLASSNGSERASGISKPTAILLLIIGFIGLMRARGRPIP